MYMHRGRAVEACLQAYVLDYQRQSNTLVASNIHYNGWIHRRQVYIGQCTHYCSYNLLLHFVNPRSQLNCLPLNARAD